MRHVTYVVDKDITDRDEAAAACTAVLDGVGSRLTARLDCSAEQPWWRPPRHRADSVKGARVREPVDMCVGVMNTRARGVVAGGQQLAEHPTHRDDLHRGDRAPSAAASSTALENKPASVPTTRCHGPAGEPARVLSGAAATPIAQQPRPEPPVLSRTTVAPHSTRCSAGGA
jgi:hypothetical protein